jgi:hypothetical protein
MRKFIPPFSTWDDVEIASIEVTLANPAGSPKHLSADYYYKIPMRPIYKQYGVYPPGAVREQRILRCKKSMRPVWDACSETDYLWELK